MHTEKQGQRMLLNFNKHCLPASTRSPAILGKTPNPLCALGAQMRARMNAHVGAHRKE